MQEDHPRRPAPESADKDHDAALKKPRAKPKGAVKSRDARLEAALRDNLRRRKAAQRKD